MFKALSILYLFCSFFIILRGTVSLLFDPNYQLTMAAANTDSLLQGSMGSKTRASVSVNRSEKKYRSRNRYGTEIEKLRAGDFFGHNALSQREEASLHSALADEPLELLAVKAEVFAKVLLQPFQDDFRSKAEYLSSIEFFSGWSPHLIRQLIFTLREKKYHPGECIFRQDVPTHCIYIVKSGSIKLSTHNNRKPTDEIIQKIEPERDFLGEILAEGEPIPPKESQISSISKLSLLSGVSRLSLVSGMPQSAPLDSQSKSALNLPEISRRRSSITPGALLNVARRKSIKPNENEKKKVKTIPVHLLGFKLPVPCPEHIIEICNLGPGELLGEVEAMCELQHHLFNAVCMSTTTVYEVDLFHIEQLLHKKAPRTLYSILRHIVQKIESWHSRHSCVQFFEPLKTLLNQVDKRLTSEGANKPVRRQHNYDACTLALMATRSLGKPVLSANARERRNTEAFLTDENTNNLNCRRFSSLYGYTDSSPSHSPRERCHSTPPVLFDNSEQTLSPLLPPKQEVDTNLNLGVDHRQCQSAKSGRGIPKPIKIWSRGFSFDAPAPRHYRTKPNLMSSVRFPIPPPSPYPVKEDWYLINSPKPQKVEDGNIIETIKLSSLSPSAGQKRRCQSANVQQVCLKPTFPRRPKTAGAFPNQTSPTSTVNTFLSESTQFNDLAHSFSLNHSFPSPTVQKQSTSNTESIPIATTSEGDVIGKVSNVVNNIEVMNHKKSDHEVYGNTRKQQDIETQSVKEATKTMATKHSEISCTAQQQKQVRISEKLEFLGPKCPPPVLDYAPNHNPVITLDPVVVPMEVVKIESDVEILCDNTEGKVQELKNDVEELPTGDLETTIPEEYMKLQRPSSTLARSSSSSTPNTGSADSMKERGEEMFRCSSAKVTQTTQSDGEQTNKEPVRASSTAGVYKCVNLNYPNHFSYHKR